jgi:Raf kinase inhibitor-like YbhB/YbcL family protein
MKPRIASRGSAAANLIALIILGNGIVPGEEPKNEGASSPIKVTSSAFEAGESIPAKYTCDGADISPPLKWAGAPAGAKSFALICDDPDAPAGTWVHWALFNLPAPAAELGENVARAGALPGGAIQGTNSFTKIGFGGPFPPPGKPHRYFFRLYALDGNLALKPGTTKQELLHAMQKHVVAQGQIMGAYQRRK